MDTNNLIKQAMSELGKRSAKKRNREYYVNLARKRWDKKKKTTSPLLPVA